MLEQSTGIDPNSGKYIPHPKGGEKRWHHEYDEGMPYLSGMYIHEVLEKYKPKENGLYLDIGGGTGEVAKKMDELFQGKTFVTDVSYEGLSFFGVESGAVAEATAQPFADETFDLVHSKDVLVHVEDKDVFLREVFRLLKPGSFAILTTAEEEDGRMVLYYGIERNEKVDVVIQDNEDYLRIFNELQAGGTDTQVVPGILHEKKEAYIDPADRVVSISPPYFRTVGEEIAVSAEEIGFELVDFTDYKPTGFEAEWYLNPRKIIVLRKPEQL